LSIVEEQLIENEDLETNGSIAKKSQITKALN
jgi:hypothetical protein